MIRYAVGAIVFQGDSFLLVHKTKINTPNGKEAINGEWDFIKGGIEETDGNWEHAILRELEEETGSTQFTIIKQYDEKICFSFPADFVEKIGYKEQETTMFLVGFTGSMDLLRPIDDEIGGLKFVSKEEVCKKLTHKDTRDFFEKIAFELNWSAVSTK